MKQTSLTGTASFASRLLGSERWRVRLMATALLFTLTAVIVRRIIGDEIMSHDGLFYASIAILVSGLGYQCVVLAMIRRDVARGQTLPRRHWIISVSFDLAMPSALLLTYQLTWSDHAATAVGAPAMLLMPLVSMLSILRLRPWFSLATGVCSALLHAALVSNAMILTEVPHDHLTVLFSYSFMILLIGGAAAAVALKVRSYVVEAVEEATAAEATQRSMALIEQDLRVARDIQLGLLPAEHPSLPGFEFAGLSRPAAHAGGDYYDWQPLPDGRLLVAIADVTGHGIGPALVTAVCRAYSRASAPGITSPLELLGRLNQLVYEDVKGARFITMVLALLSSDGRVELVSAGHGPTLICRTATRDIEWFGGDGLPLAVVPDEDYGPSRTLDMSHGDVLVLLTDGFFEQSRTSDGEQFGIERLTAVLRDCASQTPEQIIAMLDAAVRKFSGNAPQGDDMTIVVIKRQAAP